MKDMLAQPALGGRTPLSGAPARYSALAMGPPHENVAPPAWQDCCYINTTQLNSRKLKVVRKMNSNVDFSCCPARAGAGQELHWHPGRRRAGGEEF